MPNILDWVHQYREVYELSLLYMAETKEWLARVESKVNDENWGVVGRSPGDALGKLAEQMAGTKRRILFEIPEDLTYWGYK